MRKKSVKHEKIIKLGLEKFIYIEYNNGRIL